MKATIILQSYAWRLKLDFAYALYSNGASMPILYKDIFFVTICLFFEKNLLCNQDFYKKNNNKYDYLPFMSIWNMISSPRHSLTYVASKLASFSFRNDLLFLFPQIIYKSYPLIQRVPLTSESFVGYFLIFESGDLLVYSSHTAFNICILLYVHNKMIKHDRLLYLFIVSLIY